MTDGFTLVPRDAALVECDRCWGLFQEASIQAHLMQHWIDDEREIEDR